MSEGCSHDCAACGENCGERKTDPADLKAAPNEMSHIKKVIAVVSGKGGVGKSLVTSLLAVMTNRQGFRTAIMDADVTGPSIPKMFGLKGHAAGNEFGVVPMETETGIPVMSVNLLLDNETDPVVWRGPIIANMIQQFWTDVVWGDVDYMYVDMPPGTGDVPLTVFQSLPVDGIIVVTSPQELVGMIVEKAVKMADMMNVPVLGIVENMSWFKCPDCGHEHRIFGESHIDEIAAAHGISTVSRLPIAPEFAAAADKGETEFLDEHGLDNMVSMILGL